MVGFCNAALLLHTPQRFSSVMFLGGACAWATLSTLATLSLGDAFRLGDAFSWRRLLSWRRLPSWRRLSPLRTEKR